MNQTNRCTLAPYLHKLSIGALPLLDVVWGTRGKHVQLRMGGQGSHTLLVVGQFTCGLASCQIPQPDCEVVRACNHLWEEFSL